jgi:hypothetical protein
MGISTMERLDVYQWLLMAVAPVGRSTLPVREQSAPSIARGFGMEITQMMSSVARWVKSGTFCSCDVRARRAACYFY